MSLYYVKAIKTGLILNQANVPSFILYQKISRPGNVNNQTTKTIGFKEMNVSARHIKLVNLHKLCAANF